MRDQALQEAAIKDLSHMLNHFGGALTRINWEEFESVTHLPDFNLQPLNGSSPEYIKTEYGVDVEVLGPWDSVVRAHPIVVGGSRNAVRAYLRQLRSTWPKKED